MNAVAFLGLGVMGGGMAARLVDSGKAVTVWNRRPGRADPLAARGARVAATPRDATAAADIVISMVADDAASRTVWLGENGALSGARSGAILVESSTLSPEWIAELAAAAAAHGCELLDAPVTGSRTHAAQGQVLFLVGGDRAAFERARPLLLAMGRGAVHLGASGSGARMKLVNNFMCGVQAAALAEALAMIEKSGLDVDQALTILIEGAPGSPLVKSLAPRMQQRQYDLHFALTLMRKDLTYAIAEAARVGVTLGTAAAASDEYARAVAQGLGDVDFSAVVEPLRR
jgi:3-hydroxyisobutyrate dehydrogenase